MTAFNKTSQELLSAVFGKGGKAWIVVGGYKTIDGKPELDMRGGGGFNRTPKDDSDCFFCCAALKPGSAHRNSDACDRVMVLVIDDVGTEVEPWRVELLGIEPSYVIESSAGNFQYGYIIDGGMPPEEYKALRLAMRETVGMAHNDLITVAIWRLPQGMHTKPERDGWKPRLAGTPSWRKFSKDELWQGLTGGPERAVEPVYDGVGGKQRQLSQTLLAAIVEAMPNDDDNRDFYINRGLALKGAGATLEMFQAWAAKWHGNRPDYNESRWEGFHSKAGGNKLIEYFKASFKIAREGEAAWGKIAGEEAAAVFDDDDDMFAESDDDGSDMFAEPEKPKRVSRPSVNDYYGYLPTHVFIKRRTGKLVAAATIDDILPSVTILGPDGEPLKKDGRTVKIRASKHIMREFPVDQISWLPGKERYLLRMRVDEGVLVPAPDCAVFNKYKAPPILAGEANMAGFWLDHIRYIYPDDIEHLLDWFAHRVQRPGEKINHALLLGGRPRIGKDAMLYPVMEAVGRWNTREISPAAIVGEFNGHAEAVIVRINELRDLGGMKSYEFYERSKGLVAAPPETIPVNTKYVPEYSVPNVCGVVMTTNHKHHGIYIPADDGRYYVAWSPVAGSGDPEAKQPDYFNALYDFYKNGGVGHVAAFLRDRDLSRFDAKAPPRRTQAFYEIVAASALIDSTGLEEGIIRLEYRDVFSLSLLKAAISDPETLSWFGDKNNSKAVKRELDTLGYEVLHNANEKRGRWLITENKEPEVKKQKVLYARRSLNDKEKIQAAWRYQKEDEKGLIDQLVKQRTDENGKDF